MTQELLVYIGDGQIIAVGLLAFEAGNHILDLLFGAGMHCDSGQITTTNLEASSDEIICPETETIAFVKFDLHCRISSLFCARDQ
jgi:hypothetical protein